jgi:predicted glycosyltransferase
MFKNEVPKIIEFNGVCSKVYSYLTEDGKSKLKGKVVELFSESTSLTNSIEESSTVVRLERIMSVNLAISPRNSLESQPLG